MDNPRVTRATIAAVAELVVDAVAGAQRAQAKTKGVYGQAYHAGALAMARTLRAGIHEIVTRALEIQGQIQAVAEVNKAVAASN